MSSSLFIRKNLTIYQPPALGLGGEKVFFDISETSHNASNFLYIKLAVAKQRQFFYLSRTGIPTKFITGFLKPSSSRTTISFAPFFKKGAGR